MDVDALSDLIAPHRYASWRYNEHMPKCEEFAT
jgi:hypothetical protein